MRFLPRFSAVILLIVLLGLSGCGKDELTRSAAGLQQAWDAVEHQYSRRLEAVPAALDAVRHAEGMDRQAFEAATRAYQDASRLPVDSALDSDPVAFDRFKQSQGELTAALFRLLVAAEADPELRATPGIMHLRRVLTVDQKALDASRAAYSDALSRYNRLVHRFPTRITAWIYGFEPHTDFVSLAAGG